MNRSSAISAKDPQTAESRFYHWLEDHPGNRTGDSRSWVKDLKMVKDAENIYHAEYEEVKATVVKAAGLPNQTDCDNRPAYRFKEEECSDGFRPGTCDHKPHTKKAQPAKADVSPFKAMAAAPKHDNQIGASLINNCQPHNEIEVSRIFITKWNPRTNFDNDKLKELADSIEKEGLYQPIVVRPKGEKSYELVIGERRLRAFRLLKRDTIPATIKDMTDEQVVIAMLSENLQREDLNPIEEADGLKRVLEMSKGKLTQTELAERIGMSQETISQRLKLLEASDELRGLIIRRLINSSNALELLSIKNKAQYDDVMVLIRERLKDKEDEPTTKQLRKMIDGLANPEVISDNYKKVSQNTDMPSKEEAPRDMLETKFSPIVEACIAEAADSSKALNESEPKFDNTTKVMHPELDNIAPQDVPPYLTVTKETSAKATKTCPTCGGKGWVV